MTAPTDERIRELIRHHKERAVYFEQASDNGRLPETLDAATPHWELYDALCDLRDRRDAEARLVAELSHAENATQTIARGAVDLRRALTALYKLTDPPAPAQADEVNARERRTIPWDSTPSTNTHELVQIDGATK